MRVTAAIAVLVDTGFWVPAILGSIAKLAILRLFRVAESKLPSERYTHHHLRF